MIQKCLKESFSFNYSVPALPFEIHCYQACATREAYKMVKARYAYTAAGLHYFCGPIIPNSKATI